MPASATERVLHDLKGSFGFDAGAVCLDFAHTGGGGRAVPRGSPTARSGCWHTGLFNTD